MKINDHLIFCNYGYKLISLFLYLSKKGKMKGKINVELIQIVKSGYNQGIILLLNS